jgi:hypothetical protein
MKGATFQRRPPRTHGQYIHTLGTKDVENNNFQESQYIGLCGLFLPFLCFWPLKAYELNLHLRAFFSPNISSHIPPANVRAYQLVYSIKRTFPPGKITVFTFVLCPHTTTPLVLLPWKMKKNQVYKTALGDLVLLFPLCCAFGVPVLFCFGVRRFVGPQFPHRQLSAHMDALRHLSRPAPHICTRSKTYIVILRKET